MVLGGTLQALQVAQSARNYLDNVGKYETKIMLISDGASEITKTLGSNMEKWLKNALSRQRISYQPNCRILDIKGDNELERIVFNKYEDIKDG